MTAPAWTTYVGLPYRLGADPENGKASDCIHLAFRVLETGGKQPPPMNRQWYRWLVRGEIEPIMRDWLTFTEPVEAPEDYAMTLLSSEGDFCVGIVVGGGLMMLRKTTGVTWVPLPSLLPMQYRRLVES